MENKENKVEVVDKKKKKGGKINKIIMGAVIGGAIGSVVGATVRKNQNTTKEEKPKKGFFKKIIGVFSRKKKN